MNDQEINIAIAEACGWENAHKPGFPGLSLGLPPKDWPLKAYPIPNYYGKHYEIPYFCRDLNAMHEAEKTLNMDKEHQYGEWLRIASQNIGPKGGYFIPNGFGCFALAHLSARQRAEAFLRTLGKWEEVGDE